MQHDETRTIAVDPDHAARVVGDFCDSVGVPVPTGTSDVCELLDRLGYQCTPGTLAEFVRKGYVSEPAEWDAVSVYCLMAALELRRRWKRTPCPQHDHKKTGARLFVERSLAEGGPGVNDLDRYSVEDLLLQLTQTGDRPTRECLFEALTLKLSGFEE